MLLGLAVGVVANLGRQSRRPKSEDRNKAEARRPKVTRWAVLTHVFGMKRFDRTHLLSPMAHRMPPRMMLGESGIGVMFRFVAEGGVPLAAAVELVAPGQWELVAELLARIRFLAGVVELGQVACQQHVQVGGHVIHVIELVRPLERGRQVGGRDVLGVPDVDGEGLQLGVADELAADHRPEPGPLAHGAGGGMDAYEPAPGADVALERGLLFLVVEDFVVGIVEDQGLVTLEVLVGEHRRVVGDVHERSRFRPRVS